MSSWNHEGSQTVISPQAAEKKDTLHPPLAIMVYIFANLSNNHSYPFPRSACGINLAPFMAYPALKSQASSAVGIQLIFSLCEAL